MKSKSPFTIKSPLRVQVYGGDTYESPDTVITKTVGEQVGKAITGLADNATKYMDLKGKLAYDKKNPKTEPKTATGRGNTSVTNVTNNYGSKTTPNSNSNESSTSSKIVREVLPYGTNYQGQKMSDDDWNNLNAKQKRAMNANVGANEEGIIGHDGYRILEINKKNNNVASSSGANFNGSPVKHNAGAVGSIGNADPLAGGIAGIGQQMGNQAQQRAADAGGSTGVDPFLPPPNQVAETGSYGSGGDRDMLEMNGNQINNQSIGRNTDITSQLFGSGQRASMLAMKGTPLHTKGHGGAEGHTHAEPGEYLDQTVAENKGVNDIENYKPIQKFKEKQIVVNPSTNDTIFSTNSTFEIPKAMEGITRSSEGAPKYKPVYINRKSN